MNPNKTGGSTMQPVAVHACSQDQTHIWADVLAQAVTGELIGALNYTTLAELYEDPAEKAEALEHAPGRAGPRRVVYRSWPGARNRSSSQSRSPVLETNPREFSVSRTGRRFDRLYPGAGSDAGILRRGKLSVVAAAAPGEFGVTFARIAGEEEEHVAHAIEILRAERARDAGAFDATVHRMHEEIMTTLAEMIAREDPRRPLRSVPRKLRQAVPARCRSEPERGSRRGVAALFENSGCHRRARRIELDVGSAVAGLGAAKCHASDGFRSDRPFRNLERAAAVVSVLRGPERPPVPMEDIREIPSVDSAAHFEPGHRRDPCKGTRCAGLISIASFRRIVWTPFFAREPGARARCRELRNPRGRANRYSGRIQLHFDRRENGPAPSHPETAFTTGNTLTVALIVRGIERALALAGRELEESKVLIVGASGDVGSGCARCLAPKVKRLLLSARNPDRLKGFACEFRHLGSRVRADTDMARLAAMADVVICAASMPAPDLRLDTLPDGAIICDAGYPKNVSPDFAPRVAWFSTAVWARFPAE